MVAMKITFARLMAVLWLMVLAQGCGFLKPTSSNPATRIWEVTNPDAFGMVATSTRCDHLLFLWDTQQHLHRYSFANRRLLPPLGGDQDGLPFPTALTADCSGQVLYLVTAVPMRRGVSAAVQAMDMNSGEIRREYPLPSDFLPRTGAVFIPPATLEISGLWFPPEHPAASLLSRPAERYYEGLSIAIRLSLTTGAAEPILTPYETICIGAGQCPDVHSDMVETFRGIMRVVGLPASATIGIYGPSNAELPRRISIASPGFIRTGERLQPNDPVDARMRWLGANSAITQVFAFQDGFVATHSRWLLGPDYHVGQRVSYTTYMNTYDWKGTPLQLDLKITDIPVGRDDKTIFVVDYGGEGRQDGATKIRIAQIDPFSQ